MVVGDHWENGVIHSDDLHYRGCTWGGEGSGNSIIFSFGTDSEEGPLRYFSRPTNTILSFNPAIAFKHDHSIGDVVNFATSPSNTGEEDYGIALQGYKPKDNGSDYSTFLTDPLTAQKVLAELLGNIVAAGVPVSFELEDLIYRWAEL